MSYKSIRPQITDIATAIRIYYAHPEIGNKEMTELFGKRSCNTLSKMKKAVKEVMVEKGIKSYKLCTVNTKIAYEVWGIDIDDLEYRRNKLIELGLHAEG